MNASLHHTICIIAALTCGTLCYGTKETTEQNEQLIDKCLHADYDTAKKLLDAGADPNAYFTTVNTTVEPPNTELYTTFYNAIRNKKNDPCMVQLLLDYGGDPNQFQGITSHLVNAFLLNINPCTISILIDNGARLANQQEYTSVFKTFADYRLQSPGHKELFEKFVLDLYPTVTPRSPKSGIKTLEKQSLSVLLKTNKDATLINIMTNSGIEHPISKQIITYFCRHKTVRQCAALYQEENKNLFTIIKEQHKQRFENKDFTFTENNEQTTLNPHKLIENMFKVKNEENV